MALYVNIPISQVRIGAKTGLSLMNDNSYDYAMDYYINEGARHLDNAAVFKPFGAKVYFENGVAKLPKNFVSLNGVKSLGSVEGVPYYIDNIQYLTDCGCSVDSRWTSRVGSANIYDGCIEIGIQDGEACLIYNGYNTNKKGTTMFVPEVAERALRNYAQWQFGLSKPNMYPQFREWKKDWAAQKSWLKGKIYQDFVAENRQWVLQWMNALVTDKVKNNGLNWWAW